MSTRDIREEVLAELLEEHGLTATPESISAIVDGFAHHIEMEREMESYRHDSAKAECSGCKALRDEITRLESGLETFRKNVRQRHGLSDSAQVYVEHGRVLYDQE